MATWIAHLRIAENFLAEIPYLDQIAFTFGSLAPDSGIPNADWTQFDPPKEVTHFLRKGEDESEIHDLEFYRAHLANLEPQVNNALYSFVLGYYFHLVCDRVWAIRIGATSKREYASLIAERGYDQATEIIKTDWYGLDQRYVRDHPTSIFWRVLMPSPNPPQYLPFVSTLALNHQLDFIRKFYSKPDSTWVLDRPFPYLNEATMARWIADMTAALLEIYKRSDQLAALDGVPSALVLLDENQIAPFDPPLGDAD